MADFQTLASAKLLYTPSRRESADRFSAGSLGCGCLGSAQGSVGGRSRRGRAEPGDDRPSKPSPRFPRVSGHLLHTAKCLLKACILMEAVSPPGFKFIGRLLSHLMSFGWLLRCCWNGPLCRDEPPLLCQQQASSDPEGLLHFGRARSPAK